MQKYCFIGGMIGFAIIVILLLAYSKTSFISSFDSATSRIFGTNHAYEATNADAAKNLGYTAPAFGFGGSFHDTMLLVPLMMFYLLWPNWGTTLYGEIRGASDFKRVFTGMFAGLWTTVLLSVVFLLLFAKTFGWNFYMNANAEWYGVGKAALPIFPYPVLMASWLIHNSAVQVILLLLMSLWFFGWVGTLFLSSTRVIFAAAFDRVLPDAAAQVSEKRRVPVASLVLMLLPAVGLAALYAYNTTFHTYTLDATLVIAVTYLGSAIAVVILPWRKPDLWAASPASKFKLLRRADRAGGRRGHDRAARVQPVRVADQRRVLRQQQGLADLHGRDVRARHLDLRGRPHRPQPPGHRPQPDQQGDPGRVVLFVLFVLCRGLWHHGGCRSLRACSSRVLRVFLRSVSDERSGGADVPGHRGQHRDRAGHGARAGPAGRARLRGQPVPGEGGGRGGRDPAATGNDAVSFLPLDLADLDSVRACAASFLARGEPLHVLVNNAGVVRTRGLTKQGFELMFGVNHLGHFVLTNALLGCLEASAPARVVTVSSDSHYAARGIDWDALRRPERGVTGLHGYAVSKLCNVLFSRSWPAGPWAPGSPPTRCTRAWWRRTSGGGCRGRSGR